eukprot:CAMPEP_0115131456 /NCGR_PEP_ID=MMETSP0227-20121206/53133_1 /TAXON_ID=89957 /ORGANISM="Polarella glacialis, Strain CCMP 1383" /LENGTH=283 /DNA_ID=CAMNT_0002536991 /DNA_START=36 /DNA_END=887 /DNA_ORIENTATION=-
MAPIRSARVMAVALAAAVSAVAALRGALSFTLPSAAGLSLRGAERSVAERGAFKLPEAPSSTGASSLAVGALAMAAVAAAARRQRSSGIAMRAVSEIAQIKLLCTGGKATPAPPVGPAIGSYGLNIAMFVKEFNALTSDKVGDVCPCIVHVFSDKSFSIELKTPPTAALLHKAVGADKGAGKPGTEIIGKIDMAKLEEISRIKLPDLNVEDIHRAMKIIHGTAVASGVEVEGYDEWVKTKGPPKPKTILSRWGPGIKKLPAPWGEGPPLEDAAGGGMMEEVKM